MGPDFLIATDEDASRNGADDVNLDGINRISIDSSCEYSIDESALAQLHSILIGVPFDRKILDDYEQTFAADVDHGPWLIRLPDDFTDSLHNLDYEQVESIAIAWQPCFEDADNVPSVEWIAETIFQLRDLAIRGKSQGKSMYWYIDGV